MSFLIRYTLALKRPPLSDRGILRWPRYDPGAGRTASRQAASSTCGLGSAAGGGQVAAHMGQEIALHPRRLWAKVRSAGDVSHKVAYA